MRLARTIACLVMWGLIIWLAARFGLGAGLAGMGLLVCAATIDAAEEEISKGE